MYTHTLYQLPACHSLFAIELRTHMLLICVTYRIADCLFGTYLFVI